MIALDALQWWAIYTASVFVLCGIAYCIFSWGWHNGRKQGRDEGYIEGYFAFREELREHESFSINDLERWVRIDEWEDRNAQR